MCVSLSHGGCSRVYSVALAGASDAMSLSDPAGGRSRTCSDWRLTGLPVTVYHNPWGVLLLCALLRLVVYLVTPSCAFCGCGVFIVGAFWPLSFFLLGL